MKLPSSVLVSAAVHAVLIGWFAARELSVREDAPPPRQVTPIEIVPPAPPAPELLPPLDVQFLDESTTRAIEPLPPPPVPRATRPARVAASEGSRPGTAGGGTRAGTGTTEPGPTTGEPGTRSPYFDMRRGARVDLSLPAFRDDLERVPAGTGPARGVARTGQLEDSAGGRKKSDHDVFVAKVDRDGTVKFEDAKNLQVHLSWNPAAFLSGRFDINDYLMRRNKNDPYASRKLKFLDETRDERVELGKQWRQQQLRQTTLIMRKNLERAWASSADYAAKKRALFELWDEIVEPEAAHDAADEVLAEASRTARKAVVGFIRARLPHGSDHAYSDAELVAFNAKKQSSATFAPYE